MMAANRRRGEISAVFDGRDCRLCLTLGTLAELEDAFGVGDLNALAERFSSGRLSARDMMEIIAAGLRGGGQSVSARELGAMSCEGGLAGFAKVAGELLEATFGVG
jgi:Phage tail tube protein, GTA-gp10